MKKINILKKNWEFQDIIQTKNQLVSNSLIIYFRKKQEENSRIGISVPKKFANAVFRNKYKRQVKNALDIIKPWNMEYDIIIILRKTFLKLSFEKKIDELKNILERL